MIQWCTQEMVFSGRIQWTKQDPATGIMTPSHHTMLLATGFRDAGVEALGMGAPSLSWMIIRLILQRDIGGAK